MTVDEALDIVARGAHGGRLRWLCSEENPDVRSREGYRRNVLALADAHRTPEPTTTTKIKTAVHEAAKFVRSGLRMTSALDREDRLAICYRCEHYLPASHRCWKCGCHMPLKTRLETAHCPIGKW